MDLFGRRRPGPATIRRSCLGDCQKLANRIIIVGQRIENYSVERQFAVVIMTRRIRFSVVRPT
ncbi:hypothetical protein OHA40_01230 [Nocardia sp. NBC_00508]|uniref:hypothetical protein n=1 Tax=Nocardia sp. NBC_00508 TaxID=2975992 RepID=UPI002E80A76E|nr:hypothetical protein [Nocardia sp. NBC_00508]WUD66824.1 hypothetical protein OHA40_01230 [Nocardia sp. NBC_00508]